MRCVTLLLKIEYEAQKFIGVTTRPEAFLHLFGSVLRVRALRVCIRIQFFVWRGLITPLSPLLRKGYWTISLTTLRVSVFSDDLEPFELLGVYGGRGEGWGDTELIEGYGEEATPSKNFHNGGFNFAWGIESDAFIWMEGQNKLSYRNPLQRFLRINT